MKMLTGIMTVFFGHSALADVGNDLACVPPYQAVDRVHCIYSQMSANDNFISPLDMTDEFYIVLPSASTKVMYSFEEISFEAQTAIPQSTQNSSMKSLPLKGILKIENQNFGILISGEVEAFNPFLGVKEILKHSEPSLYIEHFSYFKNRPRKPNATLFSTDFNRSIDKIGGGLACFLETRFINRDWQRVDGGSNGPANQIREVRSKLIRRG